MHDAEFRKHRRRIRRLARKWEVRLRLTGWKLKYEYSRGKFERDGSYDHEAVAIAKVNWPYCMATITFDMEYVAVLDDAELEEVFVHECVHVLLREMREDGIDHAERVTTQLTWVILGLARK